MTSDLNAQTAKAARVFVCTNLRLSGKSCAGQDSKKVLKALQNRADERVLDGHPLVEVEQSVCMGYCGDGPNVKIIGGNFHHGVGEADLDKILDEAEATLKV